MDGRPATAAAYYAAPYNLGFTGPSYAYGNGFQADDADAVVVAENDGQAVEKRQTYAIINGQPAATTAATTAAYYSPFTLGYSNIGYVYGNGFDQTEDAAAVEKRQTVAAVNAPARASYIAPYAYNNGLAYNNLGYSNVGYAYGYPFKAEQQEDAAAVEKRQTVAAVNAPARASYVSPYAFNNGLAYNNMGYNNLGYSNLGYAYGYPFKAEQQEEAAAVEKRQNTNLNAVRLPTPLPRPML